MIFFSISRNSDEKINLSLKSDKNNGYFTNLIYKLYLILSWSVLLRMRNASDNSCRENKKKTHILCLIILFRKSCPLWYNVEKCCRAGQATDDSMKHAYCMLVTEDYKRTLRMWSTSCFFPCNSGCRKAPQNYVIHKMPVLFYLN